MGDKVTQGPSHQEQRRIEIAVIRLLF